MQGGLFRGLFAVMWAKRAGGQQKGGAHISVRPTGLTSSES